MDLRAQIEAEALAARRAVPALTDDAVRVALSKAGSLCISEQIDEIVMAANALDVEDARDRLDPGTLDRLRLRGGDVMHMGEMLGTMASSPALEREIASRPLYLDKRVTERRIPIGVVGANFEARPGVAIDVASQLLKSLNGGVLRTGGAALRTVTVLVDEILRPALKSAGLPPEVIGLVRSADHEGARILVSLPRLIPLVILRGSGETTAALARHAAEQGVRTLAHAEGGGVLYVHPSASPERLLEVVAKSVDRLGVCNRLNLCLVDRAAAEIVPELIAALAERDLVVRGDVEYAKPFEGPIGHEWANDPDDPAQVTVCYVDSLEEAVRIANEETSGLAAAIVAEDAEAANVFLDSYRGTAVFWNESTRLTDGWKLTGAPETGINVDWTPGPRGPVTYRDLWLRQYRVTPDGGE
jgi:glutamate-5-semialdehyde dehydrogenase